MEIYTSPCWRLGFKSWSCPWICGKRIGLVRDCAKDALEAVWDMVSDGGIVVVDDFFHKVQGPARASAERCGWFWERHLQRRAACDVPIVL